MRFTRALALATFAAAAVAVSVEPAAAVDAKAEKKKKRLEALAAALAAQNTAKPAPASDPVVPAKDAGPRVVKPIDPAALAKLIDQHIDKKLAAEKLVASPGCSDAEFLRRASLDIAGVIPTGDKARAFLDSTDPQKRAKLVDELLASPQYGRHQADLWVPKLYPKDSNNRFVQKEPFVQWMAEEFHKNTPWDKFVTNIVAETGTVDKNPGLTFFLANRAVDKITDAVSQHFLGIQLQCAQCHNHPFTGWKQEEYWGVAAFFSKVQSDKVQNANKGGDNSALGVRESAGRSKVKDFFPEGAKDVPAKYLGGATPKLGSEPYRPVFATWMTSPDNPYFSRAMVNRTWHQFFGSGFVNPIDDMMPENTPTHPDLLDAMAKQFAGGGYDVKQLIRAICLTNAYQRSSKSNESNKDDHELFSHMAVKVLIPEMLYDSLQVATGASEEKTRPGKAANNKGMANGPREQFTTFFLAGAEQASTTEYEAGIPQALRLMNSNKFNGGAAARGAAKTAPPAETLEKIYLGTLSRRPTADEVATLTAYLSKQGNSGEAYGDVLWAVLNSSEFTLIR